MLCQCQELHNWIQVLNCSVICQIRLDLITIYALHVPPYLLSRWFIVAEPAFSRHGN